MNENHARVCPSPEWAEHIRTDILPRVTAGASLGDELLEVGPGPGAATEWLRTRVRRLVAVEQDPEAARALAARYAGSNVEVVLADAAELPFARASFDAVACFTMLHHVPTIERQNRVLAELLRVLRPGGALLGSDSLGSDALHHFHVEDTYNPVEPASFLTRLQTLGYEDITLSVDKGLMFRAHRPAAPADGDAPPPPVPEARLRDGVPETAGWFVVNAGQAPWLYNRMRGVCRFGGQGEAHFDDVGISLYRLEPGQPMALYHHEAGQEDFFVLQGRCRLIVEGRERQLERWDFVHCPPRTAHTIVGDGDEPALVLAVGARRQRGSARYPFSEVAARHGAGVEPGASPDAVYARFGEPVAGPPPPPLARGG